MWGFLAGNTGLKGVLAGDTELLRRGCDKRRVPFDDLSCLKCDSCEGKYRALSRDILGSFTEYIRPHWQQIQG